MVFAFSFSSILNILIFLVILCITISIHELGHLTFAKHFNVYCYEYSIGFGKAIYTNKKGETHFCIRLIPLGGFVRMAGEEGLEDGEELLDNNDKPLSKKRIFANIKNGPKIMILAAGGIFNMILAYVCFFFVLVFNGVAITNEPVVKVINNHALANQIQEELVDSENHLLDKVPSSIYIRNIEVNYSTGDTGDYKVIENWDDLANLLNGSQKFAKEGVSRELIITFSKSKKDKNIYDVTLKSGSIKDEKSEQEKYLFENIGINYVIKKYNVLEAIPQTYKFMFTYFVEVCKAFGRLFTGHTEQLSGLVGIYKTVDETARTGAGAIGMIYIAGAISFSLGFFNLMPIPALDGGRIVFVLIESLTRKKVNPKIEGWIHTVGFILLFGLMIVINIRDIIKLF